MLYEVITLVERALLLGYDYVATGHYARIDRDAETGRNNFV